MRKAKRVRVGKTFLARRDKYWVEKGSIFVAHAGESPMDYERSSWFGPVKELLLATTTARHTFKKFDIGGYPA